jgi:NhaA family Na+:H+ antiporter
MHSNLAANVRALFNGAWKAKVLDMTHDFFKLEAAGGIVLLLFSAFALIIANSPLFPAYDYLLNGVKFSIGFTGEGDSYILAKKTILHWINDGMMVIFFFLVGLELKREMTDGALASFNKALLPILTAIGGMAVPALIYAFVNMDSPETIRGWAIPCATDIAFALCVISLVGPRVPIAIKVLFLGLTIMDDIGAIIVIALFYTEQINMVALIFSLIIYLILYLLNRRGVVNVGPYILCGFILWILVLESGVHATLAGVATALFIPVKVEGERRSPCRRLEHDLHPWVAFFVLPIFGFANAGVPFSGLGLEVFLEPITLGIILALVIGKQVGIFGTVWLCVKSGLCPMPEKTNWSQIYAMAVVCGIGFTMSLFIGGLSFSGTLEQAEVRLGVLTGSLISAVTGYILLKKTCRGNHETASTHSYDPDGVSR